MRSDSSIGRMRMRLTLESPQDEPDGAGGVSRTWRAGGRVWGEVASAAAQGTFEAGQEGQRVTRRITIRYREDLRLGQRLRAGTRIFEPRSFHDIDGTRRFLAITAEETSA